MTWVIDCGHWHCPERHGDSHQHDSKPEHCPECEQERPQSDRATRLAQRALSIAGADSRPEGDAA